MYFEEEAKQQEENSHELRYNESFRRKFAGEVYKPSFANNRSYYVSHGYCIIEGDNVYGCWVNEDGTSNYVQNGVVHESPAGLFVRTSNGESVLIKFFYAIDYIGQRK